jgi:xylulokinase
MSLDPYELINAQIALVPPGANGVTFLPYLAGADGGARGDSYARGAFLGLSLSTTKREIARAVMEGITFEMKDNFEAQKKAGVNIKEVRLTGGATKSKLWNQMQADIYGVPVKLLQTSETGCLGAAIYAGIGAGLFKTYNEAVEKVVHVKETYTPNPANFAAYEKAFGLFQKAYDSLNKGGYFKKTHE